MIFAILGMLLPQSLTGQPLPDQPQRQYVPIEKFQTILHRDRHGVLLEAGEFAELWSQAHQNQDAVPRGSAALVLQHVEYTGVIEDHLLVIDAKFKLTQFLDGWYSIPLLFDNLTIEKATVGDQAAHLGRNSRGELLFFHDQKGDVELALTLATKLVAVGSDQLASFSLASGPPSSFSLTIPAGKHLLLAGRSLERPAEIDAAATYQFPVGGSSNLQLQITDRQNEATTDSLVFANSMIGVDTVPGEIRWRSLTQLRVYGQKLDRVELQVPTQLEVADVTSGGLDSWEMGTDPDDDDFTLLTLEFRQPISGSQKIELRGVLAMPSDEEWTIPQLAIKDIDSHVGYVLITHPSAVRLQFLTQEGVQRFSNEQLPQLPKFVGEIPDRVSPQIFEFYRQDFTLDLLMRTREQELIANIQNLLRLDYETIEYQSEITLRCRYAPLFDVDLELPATWLPTSLTVNSQPHEWADISEEAGTRRLRIKLADPLMPGQELKLHLKATAEFDNWPPTIDPDDDPMELELPQILLPQVDLYDGRYLLETHPDFDVRPVELFSLHRVLENEQDVRLTYDYQDTEFTGVFALRRHPTRLSAQTISFARKDPRALRAYLQADVSLEGSGVRELSFRLPESAGTNLRFQVVQGTQRIVEQVPSEPDGGEIAWSLIFSHRISDSISIAVQTTEALSEETETVEVPRLILEEAERQFGAIAVEAGPEQNLAIEAVSHSATPLREIDPQELPAGPRGYEPQERIVGAYQYVSPDYSIELSSERFDRTSVLSAVAESLHIDSLLVESGHWEHEAEFQISASGVQAVILGLPEGAQLWSVTSDGIPVEVRKLGDRYLIPLIMSDEENNLQPIRVFYETRTESLHRTGRLEEFPPTLSVELEDGEQFVEVLSSEWNIHTSRYLEFVESRGLYQPVINYQPLSLVTAFHDMLERVSWRRVIGTTLLTLFLLAVVGLFLKATSGRIGTALLIFSFFLVMCVGVSSLILSVGDRARNAYQSAGSDSSMESVEMAVTEFDAEMEAMDFQSGTKAAFESDDTPVPAEPMEVPALGGIAGKPGGIATREEKQAVPQIAQQEAEPLSEMQLDDTSGAIDSGFALMQSDGARLSVAMSLEIPEDHRTHSFLYHGTQFEFENPPLIVRYLKRQTAGGLTALVVSITLIVFFLQRHRKKRRRCMIHVMCFTVPMALMPIFPENGLFILDGIVLGSFIAGFVWACACCWTCCCLPVCSRLWNCCRPKSLITTILLVACSIPATSFAEQPAPAAPSSQQAVPQQKVLPPRSPKPNWTVIVPYAKDQDPLNAEKVFLSREQYLELWNRAHPENPINLKAAAGLSSASFVAKPDGKTILVTARMVISSSRDQSSMVTLPFGRVALESATLDSETIALKPSKSGNGFTYDVEVSGSGIHLLDLVFRLPFEGVDSSGQFTLPLQEAVVGRLTFEAPEKDLLIQVNGTTTAYRRVSENDQDSILIPLTGSGPLSVSWSPTREAAGFDRIVHVETIAGLNATSEGLSLLQASNFTVPQGSIEEALFELPEDWELQSLSGADVGGWELEEDQDRRLLRIFLRRTVDDQTRIEFVLFQSAAFEEDPVDVSSPHLRPLQVTGEKGMVALFSENQLRVRPGTHQFLSQIETTQFPDSLQMSLKSTEVRYAYRFARSDYELPLSVTRRELSATAKTQHGLMIESNRVRVATRHVIDLSESPRSRVSIYLPENYVLLDVQATEIEDWYQTYSADDDRILVVEFPKVMSRSLEVVLQGYLRKEPIDDFVEIIMPVLLEMSEDQTHMAIWSAGTERLTIDDIDGWKTVAPQQIPRELLQRQSIPPVFSFEATRVEERYIALLLEKVKPQLKADTVSVINVTDSAVVYQLAIKWEIAQASADQFVFTTPPEFASKLDFRGTPLLQSFSSVELDDGRIRWTLQLTKPQSDRYFISPLATLPLPEEGEVVAPTLLVEELPVGFDVEDEEITPLGRQRHFVALVNQSQFQMTLQNESSVERIPLSELPIITRQTLIERATDIFRLRAEDKAPSWSLRTFEQRRGAAAIVNFVDLTTVLEQDGSWRTKASYLIRNSNRQFLALKIPESARLLSAVVQDQPVRPVVTTVNDTKLTLLPLPKTSDSDLSFFAEIILAGRLPTNNLVRGLRLWADESDLPAPAVVSTRESPQFGIPVTRTAWTVWLPESLQAEVVDDIGRTNLSPQQRAEALIDLQVTQLKEINLMLSSAKGDSKLGLQRKYLSNIEKLNRRIEEQRSNESSFSLGRRYGQSKLAEEERLLEDNRRQLESELKAQQQSIQTDSYDFYLKNFESLDERSQRQLLESSNGALLGLNNTITVPQSDMPQAGAADKFYFGLQFVPNASDKAAEKENAKKDRAVPELQLKKRISNSDQAEAFGKSSQLQRGRKMNRFEAMDSEDESTTSPFPSNQTWMQLAPPRAPAMLDADGVMSGFDSNANGPMAGGGFGGGVGSSVELGEEVVEAGEAHATGMSLKFDLPTVGKPITFSKVGGEPRLALAIKPVNAWDNFNSALWSAIWVGLSFLVGHAIRDAHIGRFTRSEFAYGFALFGFSWCIILPLQIAFVGGILILTGVILWWIDRSDRNRTATAKEPS